MKIKNSHNSSGLKIILWVSGFLCWQTYFHLHGILTEIGKLSSSTGWKIIDLSFMIFCIVLTVVTVFLYFPIGKKISEFPYLVIRKLRSIGYFNIIFPLFGISFFLICLADPFQWALSLHRLVPLSLWICLLSIFLGIITIRLRPIKIPSRRLVFILVLFVLIVFSVFFFPFLLISPIGKYFAGIIARVVLFSFELGLSSELISLVFPDQKKMLLFSCMAVISAAILIVAQNAAVISNYPFTIDWSEGKWLFDSSLIFSQQVYGVKYPAPWFEPFRILSLSIPYIFLRHPPLILLRLWKSIIYLSIPILASFFFIKREFTIKKYSLILSILWIFITFFLGPSKFYFTVIFLIILFYLKYDNFILHLFFISLALLLVPPGRVQWIPLPWAVISMVYIIKNRYNNGFIKYFYKLILLLIWSIVLSMITYLFYLRSASSAIFSIGVYLSSPFLLNRLFPNGTNIFGILPSILLNMIPLIFVLYVFLKEGRGIIHKARSTFIILLLLSFFIGGLFISIKIGGGSNIHNFDGLLLLSSIFILYVYWNKVIPDTGTKTPLLKQYQWISPVILLIPAIWIVINTPSPFVIKTPIVKIDQVNVIQSYVNEYTNENKPALFIYQTQLISSGLIKNVEPNLLYDNVQLIEMAMANNVSALAPFFQALKEQRYGIILVPPLTTSIQDRSHAYNEEHNAWVNWIVKPILCFYQPKYTSLDFDFELLVPIQNPPPCPIDLLK